MRGDLKAAPETVKKVAAAAKKSAKDAADEQIREYGDTGEKAEDTRRFYDSAVYVEHEEDRNEKGEAWLVSDNYDRMGSLVYYVATGEWFYQPSYCGERPIKGGEEEALANADLMFHG